MLLDSTARWMAHTRGISALERGSLGVGAPRVEEETESTMCEWLVAGRAGVWCVLKLVNNR